MAPRDQVQPNAQPLDDQRARALEMMLEGVDTAEVAARLEVHRSTVWRWKVEPTFAAQLAERRLDRAAAIDARVEGLCSEAIDVIASVMRDAEAGPALRLRAADAVLDRAGLRRAGRRRGDDDDVAPAAPAAAPARTRDEARAELRRLLTMIDETDADVAAIRRGA